MLTLSLDMKCELYTHDLGLLRLLDVAVLLILTLGSGQVGVQSLPKSCGRLWPLLALLPPQHDRVAHGLKGIKLLDIGRLAGILTLFRIKPVLRLLKAVEESLLLGSLDVGSVSVVKLATGVVNVLLKSVLAVLKDESDLAQTHKTYGKLTSVSMTNLSSACILPSFSVRSLTLSWTKPVYWPTTGQSPFL